MSSSSRKRRPEEGGVFFTAGVDIGAATAKAVIIDQQAGAVGRAVIRSGFDFSAAAAEVFELALGQGSLKREQIGRTLATGYGRANVTFAQSAKTEIACHAKGCYHSFPEAMTIVDIGGQDNKVIKLAGDGSRISFKMNRKCAAGTGAFLDEMAGRLGLELDRLNSMAEQARETVELGSYCTVFSATEVLEKIRHGRPPGGIVRGIYLSMIKRVMEMDSLEGRVVLTGGVAAHNPILAELFTQVIGRPVSLPPYPQLTGALGAALFAREQLLSRGGEP